MTKITTDFVGTESTAVTKQRLTDILEFWGYDPDAYTTWGNARANLNSLLSGTALGAIGATELASTFLPKINFLNDSDEVVADALFSASEPGVWLDASDITTLFQDTAGAVPVTTPGQTVARVNDKSGNGNHATQATAAARPTYGIVPEGGRRNVLTHTEAFDNAAWSKIRISVVGEKLIPSIDNNSHFITNGVKESGVYTVEFEAKADGYDFAQIVTAPFFPRTSFNLALGSLGTVAGGHAATITPTTDGYFLCRVVSSEPITQSFIQVANADNASTFVGDAVSGILVRRPSMYLGTTPKPYQRVGTQFDVTEAGVPSLGYLSFDGVDDFLQTPTITPNTDKAQVFAGVRKLSDAAASAILELSSNPGGLAGIFSATVPASVGGLDTARWTSKGTLFSSVNLTLNTAPSSLVYTGLGDISGDLATLRIDGTQVGQSTADQGTSNYLAYPMFIGARAGTSLFFNGHIHQLITRFGPNLPTGDIEKAERYVASKTAGVTL